MRLLREFIDFQQVENVLLEDKQSGEKNLIVRGIYAQSETKNRNGRIYPKHILERECYNLQKLISENKLTGALDHPEKPELRLEDACMLITKLQMDGNNVIGEARVLKDTPKGAIAYGLAKGGVKLGTSTRGLGTITERSEGNLVNEDYKWITSDLVGNPSCQAAFLDSIMEKQEWIWDNGYIKEDVIGTYYNKLKALPKSKINEAVSEIYTDFFSKLSGK